jgi:hypothetical protein
VLSTSIGVPDARAPSDSRRPSCSAASESRCRAGKVQRIRGQSLLGHRERHRSQLDVRTDEHQPINPPRRHRRQGTRSPPSMPAIRCVRPHLPHPIATKRTFSRCRRCDRGQTSWPGYSADAGERRLHGAATFSSGAGRAAGGVQHRSPLSPRESRSLVADPANAATRRTADIHLARSHGLRSWELRRQRFTSASSACALWGCESGNRRLSVSHTCAIDASELRF